MKESKRRPTSAEFERGAIVPVVMENNSNNNNYNVGASSSNSPVCASSINDSYLKPQGLLGKVASFRHLRKVCRVGSARAQSSLTTDGAFPVSSKEK